MISNEEVTMSSNRTRWRSHVGLPTDIIKEAANIGRNRIPSANDSAVRPKIIYVSRNHSIRDDTYKSELFIPKRSNSHESVVGREHIEVPLKERISFVNGGLRIQEDVGFTPIKYGSEMSSSPPPVPTYSPPPLVDAVTPPSSLNSSPPPPPIPTSSPPPLDDGDSTSGLPPLPPPPPSLVSLPPTPPSPTPSFHGNHINLAMPNRTKHEEEILRYLDYSIAEDNIIISESTDAVDNVTTSKGDNSKYHIGKDTFLITKWDGRRTKTVRAFIKPGTVEELRTLFYKLGQTNNKASAVDKRKARRLLSKRKRNDVKVQNIEFFRSEETSVIMTGIKKTDSTQSDISTTTTGSVESESSTLSDKSASIFSSIERVNVISPERNVAQLEHNPALNDEIAHNTITTSYNFPPYESTNDYNKSTIDSDKKHDLSSSNDNTNISNTSIDNVTLNEPGRADQLNSVNHIENTYLGQRLLGMRSSNASGGLGGSYNSAWASSFDMNTSDKGNDDTNEWFKEEETPVLTISESTLADDQRHSQNISTETISVIDENMDHELVEQVKPDDNTRTTTDDEVDRVTEPRIRKTSSALSSSSDSVDDEKGDSRHGSKALLHDEFKEDRPISPQENYTNLISELKRQTSTQKDHVTEANISQSHSDTSSAKASVHSVSGKDDRDEDSRNNSDNEIENQVSSPPTEIYNDILSEFKSLFMNKSFANSDEEKPEERMPVLSGHDDLVTNFDINNLDLSNLNLGNSRNSISSSRSEHSDMAASSSSHRSSRSMHSSNSSATGSMPGVKDSSDLVMVQGANGAVYVVEDITDTRRQESFSSKSSSVGQRNQSGSFNIGSTGSVRIDSKVDNDTANEVISALYGLTDGNALVIGDDNNNSMDQKSISLRSSGSTGGSVNYGVISLPGSVTRDETDDNNVTQDVKEHETVTIHGVTDDNFALIEHRIQKTITRHKDEEESIQSVSPSMDNGLTVDTGSTDYSLVGYNQRNNSYQQPILVTTQQTPVIDFSNSAMRNFNAAVLVPQDNTVISTYSTGNMVAPYTSNLNLNNSAFQAYNPMSASTTVTDKFVGTTTEYSLGNPVVQMQTNYVRPLETTQASYQQVQSLLNHMDNPKQPEEHVTTISNKTDKTSKQSEEKDNETSYYSKTTTTTIIPPSEVDSFYGSKSSRTTSEESPRYDDGPKYRIVRASMSPRRSPSPRHHTINHVVGPRHRSPSPIGRSVNHDRPSRSDVFRSERYIDIGRNKPGYTQSLNNGVDFVDDGRRVRVSKTYASNSELDKRRKNSGFVSSDSESDRNVTRVKVMDHSYPLHSRTSNYRHGYESDDEIRRLHRFSKYGRNEAFENERPESVMSDDQLYRVNRFSTSPHSEQFRSSRDINGRSLSPEHHRRYKVVHTVPTSQSGLYNKGSSYSTSRLDSGYFEPDYSTRTTRVLPSMKSTSLSPTRNSTIINVNRCDDGRVTSPTRSESYYKVVNVKSSTGENMRNSRRRRSRSCSESSESDGEGHRVKTSSKRHTVTSSKIKENGLGSHDSRLYVQRSFSPTPVDESFRISKSRSQEPVYRTRSPSPHEKYRTTVDVRREYTDNLSRSLNDISQGDKSYVVYNRRSTEEPRPTRKIQSDTFTSEKNYRMRSPTPTRDLSYRSFSNDLPNGYGHTQGIPNGDIRSESYERVDKSYRIDREPHVAETSEDKDLKVVRGQILIKNKFDASKDENDFDENANIFDNFFHLQKDNPLYQSDENMYKRFEEETIIKKKSLDDALNQDITFETVERMAKKHENQSQVSNSKPKKQNLSQLLLSRIDKIDSKDIRQHIDVKHTNEEIFGDIEFINADGTSSSSNSTKNFDSVSENVDLTLRDGKAFVIITVNAERIVPIDYEFNVWRKSAAIVTRQIEIDLFANDQRRRLYQHVMDTTGSQGAIEDGAYLRRNSRTGEAEKVLNSMQTLKLFTEILDVADGEGDRDEMSVNTRQLQGQGQLPASEEIDFLY